MSKYANIPVEEKRAMLKERLSALGIDPTKPMDPNELAEKIKAKPEASMLKKIDAAAAGVLRGATIGVSDPVMSAGRGVYEAGKGLITGDPRTLAEMYRQGFQHGKDYLKGLEEAAPGMSTAGEVAGALVPSPINVGGKIFKGAQMAGKAVTGARELGLAGRMARGAATGAVGGAGVGAVEAAGDVAMGEAAPDIGESALIGAGIEGALPLAGPVGRAAGRAGKGLLGIASGKGSAFVGEFIERGKRAMAAKTPQQFKQEVDQLYRSAAQENIDIKDDLNKFLGDAIDRQAEKLSNFSSKSYKILDAEENAKKFIAKQGLSAPLADAFEKITIYGDIPGIAGAKPVAKDLIESYEAISRLPGKIPLQDAKKLIQLIDRAGIVYGADDTFRNSEADKALKKVRKILNDRLRAKVPEYASFMDKYTAPAAKHLEWMHERLGTDGKRARYIRDLEREMGLGVSAAVEGELTNVLAGGEPHIAGAARFNETPEVLFKTIDRFQKTVRATQGSQEQLSTRLDGFFNTFTSKAESQNPVKGQLLALSSLSDANLVRMADDVALRAGFESITANPTDIFRSFAFWGGGGFLAAQALGGINPVAAALAVSLTRLYSPGVAKHIMQGLASSNQVPTVKAIQNMAIPEDVKASLISGLVNYMNEIPADKKPMQIKDLGVGVQVQNFVKKDPDPIARAKNLTTLHKDKQVDPEIVRKWILDGADLSGGMAKYFQERGIPGAHIPFMAAASEPVPAKAPASPYDDRIAELEAQHGFPEGLLKGLVKRESNFNKKAKSRVGALGLTQLMEGTARDLGLRVGRGVDDRLDPNKNLTAGAQYLKDMYDQFGDWRLALAAYNAGPGRVAGVLKEAGGDVDKAIQLLPKETREYVPAIIGE